MVDQMSQGSSHRDEIDAANVADVHIPQGPAPATRLRIRALDEKVELCFFKVSRSVSLEPQQKPGEGADQDPGECIARIVLDDDTIEKVLDTLSAMLNSHRSTTASTEEVEWDRLRKLVPSSDVLEERARSAQIPASWFDEPDVA